mmetsp:Transcript_28755/g.58911  ORF Transcript_28755/g.58911 Transcript_28755/m.58911 type:complete len:84 (-) Transcript_28755:98-349(-)
MDGRESERFNLPELERVAAARFAAAGVDGKKPLVARAAMSPQQISDSRRDAVDRERYATMTTAQLLAEFRKLTDDFVEKINRF